MKRLASNSGFTLLENVAALVLFTFLVTGFAIVFAFTSVTTYHAGHNTQATAEARSKTDSILSGGIGSTPGPGAVPDIPASIYLNGGFGSDDTLNIKVRKETGAAKVSDTERAAYESEYRGINDVEFRFYRKE